MNNPAGQTFDFVRVFAEELHEIDQRRAGVLPDEKAHPASQLAKTLEGIHIARQQPPTGDHRFDASRESVDDFHFAAKLAAEGCRRAKKQFRHDCQKRKKRIRKLKYARRRHKAILTTHGEQGAAAKSARAAHPLRRSISKLDRIIRRLTEGNEFQDVIQAQLSAEAAVSKARASLSEEMRTAFTPEKRYTFEDLRAIVNVMTRKVQMIWDLSELLAQKRSQDPTKDEIYKSVAEDLRKCNEDLSATQPPVNISQLRDLAGKFAARLNGTNHLAFIRWASDELFDRSAADGSNQPHSRPGGLPKVSESSLHKKIGESIAIGRERREAQLQAAALDRNLIGLALSGGGIRSATVGLGFLQGLAHLKLLKYVDYLSTVSGGGYIGSFLTAWIKREGESLNCTTIDPAPLDCVERQLNVSRHEQALGAASPHAHGLPAVVHNHEPNPINHLRNYSNYLTPRLGNLSLDTWTAAGTYLRNWLLTLLVPVPLFLGLLMLLFFVAALFSTATKPTLDSSWSVLGCESALFVAAVILAIAHVFAVRRLENGTPPFATSARLLGWIVLPACVIAVAASWDTYRSAGDAAQAAVLTFWLFYGTLVVIGAPAGVGLVIWVVRRLRDPADNRPRWVWRLAIVLPIGFACWALPHSLERLADSQQRAPAAAFIQHWFPAGPQGMATLGPPLVLLVFIATIALMVGVTSNHVSAYAREWWASLAGRLLLVAVGWLVGFGLLLYGPWILFERLGSPHSFSLPHWASGLLMVLWIGTTLAGLIAARMPQPAAPNSNALRKQLLRAAPMVFLTGLVLVGSWAAGNLYALALGPSPGSSVSWWRFMDCQGGWTSVFTPLCIAVVLALFSIALAWLIDPNRFSLHEFYAHRLVRCYLGASRGRDRMPDQVTDLDRSDDLRLSWLRVTSAQQPTEPPRQNQFAYAGPYPLINTALNLVKDENLAWQERKAESFLLSPAYCGSASTGYCATRGYAGEDGPKLGTAMAISGAAVSPNMGYHTSPDVTALLTVFNARLGRWLGNPGRASRSHRSPPWGMKWLIREFLGRTTRSDDYVFLSDGGHFENLGVYELVRRRCRYIIVVDAGADGDCRFEDLGNLIRKVRNDFGIRIEIDPRPLIPTGSPLRSQNHVAVGRIYYSDASNRRPAGNRPDDLDPDVGPDADWDDPDSNSRRFEFPREDSEDGVLVYCKASLTGDEPADVLQYAAQHGQFPHDATANQWYGESQFESYRALGYHMATEVFSDPVDAVSAEDRRKPKALRRAFFERVFELWTSPPPDYLDKYLATSAEIRVLEQSIRRDRNLHKMSQEMVGLGPSEEPDETEERAERHMLGEIMSVLEDAWYRLDLARWRGHPQNEWWGYEIVRWVRFSRFKRYWQKVPQADQPSQLRGLELEFSREFCEYIEQLPPYVAQLTAKQ